MTFRVIVLPQARRDVDRNADWWTEHHSVEQALRWSEAMYDQIETLADFPESNALSARWIIAEESERNNCPLEPSPHWGEGRVRGK